MKWFTQEEDDLLLSKVYVQFGPAYVAARLGRSTVSVHNRRSLLRKLAKQPPRTCRLKGCGRPVLNRRQRQKYCSPECAAEGLRERKAIWRWTPAGKKNIKKNMLKRLADPAQMQKQDAIRKKHQVRRNTMAKARRFAKAEGITVEEAYKRFDVERLQRKAGRPCRHCRKAVPRGVHGHYRFCSDACRDADRRISWRDSKRRKRVAQVTVEAHP